MNALGGKFFDRKELNTEAMRDVIFIRTIFYRKTATSDQVYSVKPSSGSAKINDGFILQTTGAGVGETHCLSIKDKVLMTESCRNSADQVWKFQPIVRTGGTPPSPPPPSGNKQQIGNDNQFLIQQASTSQCLVPISGFPYLRVALNPCNSYRTEQIWRICLIKK